MAKQIIEDAKNRMDKAVQQFKSEIATVRAGRASASLLDKIMVEYYGNMTPINQLGNISTPDPRLITIQPWDKNILADIEKSILKSEIGLTPNNDGDIIRIAIPQLTEERRQQLVKIIKKYGEDAKVSIRNVRRDANDSIKKSEKNGDTPEDEARRHQDSIQQATDDFISRVDKAVEDKEKDIMEV